MNLLNTIKKKRKNFKLKRTWTVCKDIGSKVFFIHDVDEDTGAIRWSPRIQRSVKFRTERGCNLFIRKTIRRQSGVYAGPQVKT